MNIIGIDPGSDGALVVIAPGRRSIRKFRFKDKSEKDIALFFAVEAIDPVHAFLEKVHSRPGQGVTSMFTFGKGLGFLRGCLVANRIPFDDVPPQNWQKALGLGKTYPTKADRKKAHKQQAEQWFPTMAVTLADADAFLLAEYGYRKIYGHEKAGG